jgi:YHS domain-containing protein
MSKDPICNMEVDEQAAEFNSECGSQTYYFW